MAGLGPEEDLILTVRDQATSSFTAYSESPKNKPKKTHSPTQRTALRKHSCFLHRKSGLGLKEKTTKALSAGKCQLTFYGEGTRISQGLLQGERGQSRGEIGVRGKSK